MNKLEIIAALSSDTETRLETIYSLATHAELPKPMPKIASVSENTSTLLFTIVDNEGNKSAIDAKIITELYKKLPKPPVSEYKIKSFEKKLNRTELELDSTDIVYISDRMIAEIYELLPKAPVPPRPGIPSEIYESPILNKEELLDLLEKFSSATRNGDFKTLHRINEEYKKWRNKNNI